MLDIKILAYRSHKHLKMLREMLKQHNLFCDYVAKRGFVAFCKNIPVAMGFLRLCEGGDFALFDGLVSNPYVPADIRSRAIEAIVDAVINKAKKLKVKKIFGWSRDKNTLIRSSRHGFSILPEQQLICLSLDHTGKKS